MGRVLDRLLHSQENAEQLEKKQIPNTCVDPSESVQSRNSMFIQFYFFLALDIFRWL